MEPPSQAELVCLYLDAVEGAAVGTGAGDDGSGERAPSNTPPRTVRGIATGLALEREGSGPRIGLLSTLSELADEGLVAREEVRPDGGSERSVYHLTEAGRQRATALRERVRGETVAVAGGSAEAVPLGDLEEYFDDYPLVQTLARLDDEGTIRLEEDVGSEFVDREAELERLASLLETVPQQGSRTVLVSGPAGVGKTTLVEQWLPSAREAGFRVASGRCRRDGDRPYGPLLSAFRDLEAPEDLVEPLETAAYEVDDAEVYDAQRTALFNEVADALRAQAAERPLVVFLDDLQWAGRGTRQLFAHLTRTVADWLHPVAFVATYRSEAAAGDRAFDAVVSDVADADRTISLAVGPLPASDSNGLVAWLANRPDLPDELLSALRERTGGNPLLLRATVKQLLDDGALDPDDPTPFPTDPASLPVPEDAHAAVESRIPALSERTREVLAATAVAGGTVAPGLVAAVLEEAEAVVNDHYDVLVTGHFLERTPDGVAFVGGLVRDAVVESLDDERRRQLHTAVAAAIESVEAVETRPARVAHHHEQAGDLEAALEEYRRAGDEAREVYAHEDAAEAYERALDVARELDDETTELALLETLGETAATLGRYETAREHLDAAREMATDVTTRQRLAVTVGETYNEQGEFEAASEVAEAALALDEDAENPAVAGLLGVEVTALAETGERDAAREAARRALECARVADAPAQEVVALRRLGNVAFRQGAFEEAAEHLEESLALARKLDRRTEEADALNSLGAVSFRRGDFAAAESYFEECLAIYRELGDRHGQAQCLDNLGTGAELRGELDEAEVYLEESLDIYREIGDRHGEASSFDSLGLVARERGDLDAAAAYFEKSLAIYRDVGYRSGESDSLHSLGQVARERGNLDAAEEHLEESLAIDRDIGDRHGVGRSHSGLGLVARKRGNLDAAAEHLEESIAIARDIGDTPGAAGSLSNLGRVARERGDLDAAEEHLEESLAIDRELGRHDREADSRYNLGRVARERGDLDAAENQFEQALSLAEEAGAPAVEGACRVALSVVTVERGSLEAAATSVDEGLALVREGGDDEKEVEGVLARAQLARERGELEAACDHCETALSVAEDAGHRLGVLAAREALVDVHQRRGNPAAVREHSERALAIVDAGEGLDDRAAPFREALAGLDEAMEG
jgi:tetratricopeptide (TPR) repeat protein